MGEELRMTLEEMSGRRYGRVALAWREAEDTLAAFTEEQLDETLACGDGWVILGELTATIADLRSEVARHVRTIRQLRSAVAE